MRKRLLATLLIGVLAFAACSGNNKNNDSSDPLANVTIKPDVAEQEDEGLYVLEFEATTVDGEEWNSDKLGNATLNLINVWATYCNPCLEEMPDLGEIAAEYDSADLQLIGVVSDVQEGASAEDIANAKALIEETKAGTYPHLLLSESLYTNIVGAVEAVPTTFFLDQRGAVLGYLPGAQPKEVWTAIIDELLEEMK